MTVSEQLELDTSSALGAVDALQRALEEATAVLKAGLEEALSPLQGIDITADASGVTASVDEAVAGADTTVTPEADTSGFTNDLDAALSGVDLSVGVGADTSSVTDALEQITSEAATTEAVVTVTADTTEADSAISDVADQASAGNDQLAESTGRAGSAFKAGTEEAIGLTTGLKALNVAQSTAGGSASGLSGALEAIPGPAAAAAVGIGAGVLALGDYFKAGLTVIEGRERLVGVFGDVANAIEQIHVGTLNGNLSDLALTVGTSTTKLRAAAANIGQLGQSSEASAPEIAKTTQQVLALALRARALNPALGESGDIATTFQKVLARGGPFLGRYGIALTALEISNRAMADTQKQSVAELTTFDRLAAGAAITAERYGETLGTDVASGADKAAIQVARINVELQRAKAAAGEKIVPPVLEALNALAPIGVAVASSLGSVLVALTPVIKLIAEAVKPVAAFVGGIAAIPKPVLASAIALGVFTASVATFGSTVAVFGGLFGAVVGGIAAVSIVAGGFKKDTAKFDAGVKEMNGALRDQDGQLQVTQASLQKYLETQSATGNGGFAAKAQAFGVSLSDVAKFAANGDDGIQSFKASLGELVGTSGPVAKAINGDLVGSFKNFQKEAQANAQSALEAASADGSITEAQLKQALASKNQVDALAQLQPHIDAHRAAVADATRVYGPLIDAFTGGETALNAVGLESESAKAALTDLTSGGVRPSDASFLSLAQTLSTAKLSSEGLDAAAQTLGITTEKLQGFVDGATGALNEFVSAAVDGLPTVGDVLQEALGAKDVGIQGFIAGLNQSTAQTTQFLANIDKIVAAGGQDIAAELVKQGVEAGGAYAQALGDSIAPNHVSPLVSEAEKAVDAHNLEIERATDYLTSSFGPHYIATTGIISDLASQAFDGNLDFASKLKLKAGLAEQGLDDATQAIAIIAGNGGREAAENYGRLFNIEPATVAAGIAAEEAIMGFPLPQASGQIGADAVDGFVSKYLPGMAAAGGQGVADATAAAATNGPTLVTTLADVGTDSLKAYGAPMTFLAAVTGQGLNDATLAAAAHGQPLVDEMANIGNATLKAFGAPLAQLNALTGGLNDASGAVKAFQSAHPATALPGSVKVAAPKLVPVTAGKNTADLVKGSAASGKAVATGPLFPDVGKAAGKGISDGLKQVTPEVAQRAADVIHTAFQAASDEAKRTGSLKLDPAQQAMLGFARSIDKADLSSEEFETVAKSLGVTVHQLQDFIDGTEKAVDDLADSITSKFPAISDAFNDVADAASNINLPSPEDLFGSLDSSASFGKFVSGLKKQTKDLATFMANVATITAAGGQDVADLLEKQGGAAGEKYARQIVAGLNRGDRTLLDSATAALSANKTLTDGILAQASSATAGVAGFVASLKKQDTDLATFLQNVQTIAAAGGTDIAQTLAQQGVAAGGKYAKEIAKGLANGDRTLLDSANAGVKAHNALIAQSTKLVGDQLAPAFAEAAGKLLDVSNQTGLSGTEGGLAFADGLAVGISQHSQNVMNAAAQIVRDAEAAARAEADSHSPSKLFAKLGADLGLGLGEGLNSSARQVVAEAEDIVRQAAEAVKAGKLDAVVNLGAIGSTVAPQLLAQVSHNTGQGTQQGTTITFGDIKIEVVGGDPVQARASGQAAADGFLDQLRSERKLAVALRAEGQT